MSNSIGRHRHSLIWFRRGLRLEDNPAFISAMKGAATFRCVYIIDPWFAGMSQAEINKWRFLLQSLDNLDLRLRKLNSRLFVIRGQPADVLPKLFKAWSISTLAFEEDPEPYGKFRDEAICRLAADANVEVITKASHTLYDVNEIIKRNGGNAPLTFKKFHSIISTMAPPTKPEPAVDLGVIDKAITPYTENHDEKYRVPTLEELGFDTTGLGQPAFQGGETEALFRLEKHLQRKAFIASFEKPKMSPRALYPNETCLSPYFRFGCLSPRLYYWKIIDLYKKVKRQERPPLSIHGQLLWREFFYVIASSNPNFDRMVGNPICVQIPWDRNPVALKKWAEGCTGYPWLDAIMKQLRKEGWIHHLARHSVACFLTRGDLWISWEEGAKVFEDLILDADWSVNAGMWMWLSCSSFFQQFFNTHCPINFGKKIDPHGEFIRHYLPVLKYFPDRYIYEPWTAPLSVQKSAKCIIGKDYSLPIVKHSEVSRFNMERLKQVYQCLSSPSSDTICCHSKKPSFHNAHLKCSLCCRPSSKQFLKSVDQNATVDSNCQDNRRLAY